MATVYEPWTDTEETTRQQSPKNKRSGKAPASRKRQSNQRRGKASRQPVKSAAKPVDSQPLPAKKPMFKARPESPGINWWITGWIVILHVGVLAAPFTFTWEALGLVVLLHWITGGLGVCLGYHRLFTHGSFSTYRPIRWLLGVCGVLSGEGSATDWVANHRKHHALSDKEGDPHSPHDGASWSHFFWLFPAMTNEHYGSHVRRWAPDVAKDSVLLWIGRLQLPLHFALGGALLGAGWAWGGAAMGLSFLVWGMFVRLVFVLHSTWLVNSASHMWGYTNYEAGDDSRNNWFVALLTYGEGWHNNHHAYPRMANHGHRWWEIDLTFRMLRLMQRLGLAWNVVDYKHKHREEGSNVQSTDVRKAA
ncbi:MAG: acyl-CoA desaturase [Pirellulaceae bacterium]